MQSYLATAGEMVGATGAAQHGDGGHVDEEVIRNIIPVIMSASLGIPASFHRFVSSLGHEEGFTAREGGYGCDDPFAIFGFLAFLLALLQLLVDSGGGEERRKRSTNQCNHEEAFKTNPDVREGVLGAYIMLQGFLNSLDTGRHCTPYSIIHCSFLRTALRLYPRLVW